MLLLHGHGGNAKNSFGSGLISNSPLAAWLAIVDREGIVVAALDGAVGPDHLQGWNDGRAESVGLPATNDVAFVRAVMAAEHTADAVDADRVFVMGMSNGGVMALRLALEPGLGVAAVAAACASQPDRGDSAASGSPVSVLLIEGTEDPIMPYGGGQVTNHGRRRGLVLGAEPTAAFWRRVDGLTSAAETVPVAHLGGSSDPTHVEQLTWGTSAGPQVRLLRVVGGGHAEPSLAHTYGMAYRSFTGRQNHDLESAEAAWEFFAPKKLVHTEPASGSSRR